jgi:Transposase
MMRVQQFAQMLRTRTGEHLDAWLAQVENSKLPEFQSFAAGIEKDKAAVRNGLTWSINNGMVEGHVTKLKLIRKTRLWQGRLSAASQACAPCSVGAVSSSQGAKNVLKRPCLLRENRVRLALIRRELKTRRRGHLFPLLGKHALIFRDACDD